MTTNELQTDYKKTTKFVVDFLLLAVRKNRKNYKTTKKFPGRLKEVNKKKQAGARVSVSAHTRVRVYR